MSRPIRVVAIRFVGLAIAAFGVACSAAEAASYDFVVLASSALPPFSAVPGFVPPSIDASGAVAFLASAPGVGTAIFTASQPSELLGGYTQITGRQGQTPVSVSNVGSFVGGFVAFRSSSDSTIYRGSGGPLIPLFGPTTRDDPPAVNGLGEVVITDGGKLILADVQGTTVLYQHGDAAAGGTIWDIPFGPAPDLTETGLFGFFADIDFPSSVCDEAFMRGSGSGGEVLALGWDDTCDFVSSRLVPIAINEGGAVAYAPDIFDPAGSLSAIFVDSTKVWDAHVPGFGANPSAEAVALNDAGELAFEIEDGAHFGIYTGPDPVADKVLESGDTLCDGTVTDIDFQRFGQDGFGELALYVALADGRHLIVRAQPGAAPGGRCVTAAPEPGADVAAAAGALALAGVARRKRR